MLHLDSSFGVHGGAGKYNGGDFTADTESSRFTSVEDAERTVRTIAPGCWVRCGCGCGSSAVNAKGGRVRITGGVNGSDPLIDQSSTSTGGPRVTQWSGGY